MLLWGDFFYSLIGIDGKLIRSRLKLLVVVKQVFLKLLTELAKLEQVYNLLIRHVVLFLVLG